MIRLSSRRKKLMHRALDWTKHLQKKKLNTTKWTQLNRFGYNFFFVKFSYVYYDCPSLSAYFPRGNWPTQNGWLTNWLAVLFRSRCCSAPKVYVCMSLWWTSVECIRSRQAVWFDWNVQLVDWFTCTGGRAKCSRARFAMHAVCTLCVQCCCTALSACHTLCGGRDGRRMTVVAYFGREL